MKQNLRDAFHVGPSLISSPAFWRHKWRSRGKEGGGERKRRPRRGMLCFDNLTLPPPLLRPARPCPPHQSTRSRSAGIGLWRPLTKATAPRVQACERRKTTRGYLQLGCSGRQCHHGHVMPNRRCADANPWLLPQGLFGTETEGMADRSQPEGEACPLCTFNQREGE